MSNEPSQPEIQRITRLTPLGTVLAVIETAVGPVAVRRVPVTPGRVLAEAVEIAGPMPPSVVALRDGWAVASQLTADAGSAAPMPLPSAKLVDVGDAMPADTDAVLPLDAINIRDDQPEALAPATPGDGLLPAGGDLAGGTILVQRGEFVTPFRAALMAACGIDTIAVREPRILVGNAATTRGPRIDAVIACLCDTVAAAGGAAIVSDASADQSILRKDVDATLLVGGTGSGRNDGTVRLLTAAGKVTAHGIAIAPGETTALGFVGGRPVLALPGRLDAALVAWHLLGRAIVARLTGSREQPPTRPAQLAQKVTSTVGITELVPVRCEGADATPLGSGYAPLSALAQANGWLLIRPESEGFPAGAEVMIRPWP